NDVVVIFLKRNRLMGDLAFVRAIKKRGTKIVGVFPAKNPHTGDTSLAEFSDVTLDNGLESEGGVLEVDGFDEPICPIDIVLNSMLVFALSAEIIGELLRRGRKPSVFMSARVQGGQEY